MQPKSVYDWITLALLVVAAIAAPLDDIRKRLALDGDSAVASPLWSYLPLALIAAAALIFIARAIGWLGDKNKFAWQKVQNPSLVTGKRFVNEVVPLDGFHYTSCTFENATFLYNGITAPYMTGCAVGGLIRFKSENPAIEGALLFLWTYRALGENFRFELAPGEAERFKQMEVKTPSRSDRRSRKGKRGR